MAEIISDGVRSVTSDDTSSSHRGYGFNYGSNTGNHDLEHTSERVRGHLTGLERAFSEQAREVGIAVEKTGAANQLTTEKVAAAALLNSNLSTAQLNVQAERIGATTNLAIERSFSATNIAVEKNHAASQLLSVQNAAALAASIAACCCELKEKIGADGEKTRTLVSTQHNADLAIQLADCKNEILALQASGKK